MEELERAFHKEMLRVYDEARTFGYYPTRFLLMVEEKGGLATAKQLLNGDRISEGFGRLWEEGRLDISVEAVALQERWTPLFTTGELAEARRRLDGAGYRLPTVDGGADNQ